MAKVNIILNSRCQSIIGEDTLLPARGVSWTTVGFILHTIAKIIAGCTLLAMLIYGEDTRMVAQLSTQITAEQRFTY